IPITYVQGDDDRKDGYIVEKEAYYLPQVGLTPDELAVVYAAGSAALASGAFPGSQDLAHALRKIGFFAGTEVPTPKVRMELGALHSAPELAPRLEQVWSAAAARKHVDISYFSPRSGQTTQRRVDPYGLALRRGLWSLVGRCHLRGGVRTFHVHRIRSLVVNAAKPRSADFEVPPGFRLDDHVASYPWQHTFHEPVRVRLTLSGELAPLAQGLFPTASIERSGAQAVATVTATDLDGLVKYALSLGSGCRVQNPPRAVARWREMAEKIVAAHAPRPAASIGGT
ncbi:MAG: helix-turn-helix transcriptional regulator, partial [Myxococcaceae bacterium]